MRKIFRGNNLSVLLVTLSLTGAVAAADDVVRVDSLKVKERIRSIEQIVVSAETERVAEQPSTAAVAELLEEARMLELEDAQTRAAEAP